MGNSSSSGPRSRDIQKRLDAANRKNGSAARPCRKGRRSSDSSRGETSTGRSRSKGKGKGKIKPPRCKVQRKLDAANDRRRR